MSKAKSKQNRLALESSPYLRQHENNPVDWYPWGDEALSAARENGKPILLSIGYSSCHWCHVMAHESFEDPDIAAQMNTHYINVKVDREERPDLDVIYQSALALMKEAGGWPLTMFLTPEGEPFWGGTYFPPTPRYGRPGFGELLDGIAAAWENDRDKVLSNVAVIKDALNALSAPHGGNTLTLEFLDLVAHAALRAVDPVLGGLRGAPKFPQVPFLRLLWRAWKRSGENAFFAQVETTLERMAQGGIYDHLAGGFARYSTDERWLVPHFEKMLYDNAQLISLMTQVWKETHAPLLKTRVAETIAWVMGEMKVTAPDGTYAFASALDADTEGEEGRYYVWTDAEIDQVLGEDAPLFKQTYGVTEHGNWSEGGDGVSVLSRHTAYPGDPAVEDALSKARAKLLAHRHTRSRPQRDDKVLADVNGLMIRALSEAAIAFDQTQWLDIAKDVFAFVSTNMVIDGRLHRTWSKDGAKHPGVLDDIAQMARAALALYEASGEDLYLAQAEAWAHQADDLFWCDHDGGYCLAARDVTDVITRTRTSADNALPSGNGTMADVLARLWLITGDAQYRERAETLIDAFPADGPEAVVNMPTMLGAFELLTSGGQVVVASRNGDGADMIRSALNATRGLHVVIRNDEDSAHPPGHPAHGKTPLGGRPTAYICAGGTCTEPLTELDALKAKLQAR